MPKAVLQLLRVQYQNTKSRWTAMILLAVLIIYSAGIAYAYAYIGLSYLVPSYALVLSVILVLFFTFFKTNGYLFAYADYDMLMALPVSTEAVITSRFLAMYGSNLLYSGGIMLPMAVVYGIFEKPDWSIYLWWVLIALVAPLIPMTVAAILGALIAAIGSRFRYKVLVQLLLSVALVLGVMGLQFFLQNVETESQLFLRMEELGLIVQGMMRKIYPLVIWFERSILGGKGLYAILYVIFSLCFYLLFMLQLAPRYKAINAALMARYYRNDYKLSVLAGRSVIKALMWKEWKRFTSSVNYMMNMGIGLLLAFLGTLALLIFGQEKVMDSINIPIEGSNYIYAIPFVLLFMLTMTCTSAVSLSLEGKSLWIVKSLPISVRTLLLGKMGFNLYLVMPPAIISTLFVVIALKVEPLTGLLYLLVVTAGVVLSTVAGMLVGTRFARYDWKNELEVIKQGTGTFLTVFGNMILHMGMLMLVLTLSNRMDGRWLLLLVALLYGLLAYLLDRLLLRRIKFL